MGVRRWNYGNWGRDDERERDGKIRRDGARERERESQ